jgi:glycosyltransferase involved in cell wall biosynthesis
MTISVVYDYRAFSAQKYGGVSRYIYEIAQRVDSSAGFKATVVAPVHYNAYLKTGDAKHIGCYFPKLPKTNRIYGVVNDIVSPLIIGIMKPTVVHETYYSSTRMAPKGCAVVLTVHDMIHEKFPAAFSAADRSSENKRKAVERADKIICISEHTRRDLIELFDVKAEKTAVIYHGFSLNVPQNPLQRIATDSPYLLYVGSRGGYKNFDRLLEAFAASAVLRASFRLIAFGGGNFSRAEKMQIQKLGLQQHEVQQMSGGDEVLGGLYRGASAFIYPSLYEGFGLSPLEAMSFGCPVVCSKLSSIPEIVGNAGQYFDPYDAASMRDSIEQLVFSEAATSELIIKGRERVKLFSWDACANQTMHLYRTLSGL